MPRSSLVLALTLVAAAASTNTQLSFTEAGNTCTFEFDGENTISLTPECQLHTNNNGRLDNLEESVAKLTERVTVLESKPNPPAHPTQAPTPAPEYGLTCPHDAGWRYVFEIEDKGDRQDMPWSETIIGAGYSWANSYYIGNKALNDMGNIVEAQVCWASPNTCNYVCTNINKKNLGHGLATNKYHFVKGLDSDLKKMVACFTGQCADYNGKDSYTYGWFWTGHEEVDRCSNYGGNDPFSSTPWTVPGSGSYTCGIGPHNTHKPVHYWGSGWTMCRHQNHEIGDWSDCNHGGAHPVDKMIIRVKTGSKPQEDGLFCAHEDGWEYIMEVEDDATVDDIPNSPQQIAKGYSNRHAYYIGNTALNAKKISEAEMCWGRKSTGGGACTAHCIPLRRHNAGGGITHNRYPFVTGLNGELKKMLACFTGQCPPVSGQDSYSRGWFYQSDRESERCANYGGNDPYDGQPWSVPNSGAYTCGIGPHNEEFPVHFWGSGWTMCNGPNTGNYEIGDWSNCNHANGHPNMMQLRIKTNEHKNDLCPPDAGWTNIMQIEDDPTEEDMPHNPTEIGRGFKTQHATYIGNTALNALSFSKAQVCFGKKEQCSLTCMDVEAKHYGDGLSKGHYPFVTGLNTNLKKILACFTGQCGPVNGQDSYSRGWFFTATLETERCSNFGANDAYTDRPWNIPGAPSYTCGVGPHNKEFPVHFWGSGWTMCHGHGNYEIGGWSNCNHGDVDSMVIRVKT